jgi:NADH:ubiquinone reductase (non-electrogenic)
MEPVRNILRHKKAIVKYYEAEATKIDYARKVVHINDESEIKGETSATEVPFDMLVVGVGAENATFGIPGVREHSAFLKEVGDAQEIRKRIMDCVETASFKDQSDAERKRLLHMVGARAESQKRGRLNPYRSSLEVVPPGLSSLASCETSSSKI